MPSEELKAAAKLHGLSPVEIYLLAILQDMQDQLDHISTRLDNLTITVINNVNCCPQPVPPSGPAFCPKPTLSSGDSHLAIRFLATVASKPSADTAVISLSFIETPAGAATANPVKTLDMGQADDGTFNVSIDVEQGSNVEYWANAKDAAGNPSPDSPHGFITNASDTTPPPAPAQPTTGSGDTAPLAPSLKKGVKI